ncbi:MAG: site-2 protease family protein [Pirellulaceae bacterium]
MLLAEPQRTPYDLRFQIFGFEIRVSPFFWLVGAIIGWNWATMWDEVFHRSAEFQDANPGQGPLLLIWIAVMFVSILLHELGHAFAFRYYGMGARIVLYHFGGLAISDSSSSISSFRQHRTPHEQIVISAAGPGIELVLAAILILLFKSQGYAVWTGIGLIDDSLGLREGRLIGSAPLLAAIDALLFVNVFWALLNLLPVYPLDGGQISRELFTLYAARDGIKNSLLLSVITGGAVAIYCLMNGQTMAALMFGMLAFSSYQTFQAYSGRGGHGPW